MTPAQTSGLIWSRSVHRTPGNSVGSWIWPRCVRRLMPEITDWEKKTMEATPTIDSAERASKKAVESTMLSPRFYTTDFDAMNRLDVSSVRADWDKMMAEYEGDNNHDHFQRDAQFADEV